MAVKHNRRTIRLQNHDYSSTGTYFITICTYKKELLLGEIINGKMKRNRYSRIVEECWEKIPIHFSNVDIDEFIIMPNHIHGIIVLTGCRGTACRAPTNVTNNRRFSKPDKDSLSTIVRSFKSAVTKNINLIRNSPGDFFWQRNFYDHIIRNEKELLKIRKYIYNNPRSWELDDENPININVGARRVVPG